ncbi:MAG TPA: AraC family transcriptional regulator [Pyrinomonadaceae bacterium]|jgi:AraC-like DNA-binding protein|nr:AraC family transcriptional regulator [Pyrinomonadaceae bacterium]
MKKLPDGAYAIGGEISIPGEGASPFVVGAGWLLEIMELKSGEYFFLSDGEKVPVGSKRFGIFYPPFSLVKLHVKDLQGNFTGIGGFTEVPSAFPHEALIFETDFAGQFTGSKQALEVLNLSGKRAAISINTKPSLLSLKAKRLIDENYQVFPSITRIAARLGVSPEHLSRQFKRDYELNPSSYLHQVRLAEATFKLSIGEEIAAISHDVGYNDLSRFYKQFRKATKTSPANCRITLKSKR